MRNLGDYIHSPFILGHVRAASSGHNPLEDVAVSEDNCHPFKYKNWTFVHNGSIPSFKKLKRAMVMLMKDECFHDISGSTDSECIFALFLSILPDRDKKTSLNDLIKTINILVSTILELCISSNISDPCSLNICVTDGTNLIATRFRNGEEDPPSLYYQYSSHFECNNGQLFSCGNSPPSEIIITSAPLSKEVSVLDCSFATEVCDNQTASNCDGTDSVRCISIEHINRSFITKSKWKLIPKDHMLVCTGNENDITIVTSAECRPIEAVIGNGLVYSLKKVLRKTISIGTSNFLSTIRSHDDSTSSINSIIDNDTDSLEDSSIDTVLSINNDIPSVFKDLINEISNKICVSPVSSKDVVIFDPSNYSVERKSD